MSRSLAEMLDDYDYACNIDVQEKSNEDYPFVKTDDPPFWNGWGGHEDLPMGLDLRGVA